MTIHTSYAIEIKHINMIFRNTISIYQSAVAFCIKAFNNHWPILELLCEANKDRFKYADSLIHSTKSNQAFYAEFDKLFYKMPSYLRFSVINAALGYLSSYYSNVANWEAQSDEYKKTHAKPGFQIHLHKLPTFYKDNMYKDFNNDTIKLKLFINNDWNWVELKLKHTDVESIRKHQMNAKMSAPTLEKRNKKWFLRFEFEENVKLNNTKLDDQKILAVDLGINTDATCCVMQPDGTVLARKFINFPNEKDHMMHTLNKIKKIQQRYGYSNTDKLWRIVKFHNDELASKIASAITDAAVKYGCDVIVFEYLDMQGKKKGSKKEKLHMWKKNTIQNIVTNKAHRYGIRISRILARNTSRLAYDGSGEVLRGRKSNFDSYELCRFQNGKIYNCDLSASYNIGSRYYIKEIRKSISVKKWSDIVAKVPECEKRMQHTYATLLKIREVA